MKGITKNAKRVVAGLLAAVIVSSSILSGIPASVFARDDYKPGETMLSWSEDWKFFCIDSFELLGEAGGVQGGNEWYAYVIPSTRLAHEEVVMLFWATLSLRAGKGDSIECKTAVEKVNAGALASGLMPIGNMVTENDMKLILHQKSTRDKYPWLSAVVANEDKYMELSGLLGGSGSSTSTGGKPIPTVLQNHQDPSNALVVDKNTFTIQFDQSGVDKDFIQKVPLDFSTTGGDPWEATPFGGWTYQKTDTSIIFSNPNPIPPKLMMRFKTDSTEYQSSKGYATAQEAYDDALQLWVCIECNDRHVQHSQKKLPLEAHQRLVYLQLENVPKQYYASIAGDPVASTQGGSLTFQVYRHEEEMESTYNIQMEKYDYETGKPLENAVFKLYERFDDKDQIDIQRDGPVHIYEGGEPYKSYHKDNPAIWKDFRFVSGLSTDENGYASKTINHGYHYDKTFCDGHPAPVFISVPEEEEDDETGEIINEDEIAGAQAENQRLAQAWLDCFDSCESHASEAFDGVHFHWLMPDVDKGEIESILSSGGSPGEMPNAGKITSASETESFEQSGCREDAQQTYGKFISLRYSYALVESTARMGYIRHDLHGDDLPIEVITTDSSENGANSTFAGEYSTQITVNDKIKYSMARETLAARERISAFQFDTYWGTNSENIHFNQEKSNYKQDLIRFLVPDREKESEDESDPETDSELLDDVTGSGSTNATPSNAATPSNSSLASPSNLYRSQVLFGDSKKDEAAASAAMAAILTMGNRIGGSSQLFVDAYNTALSAPSSGGDTIPGPDNHYSHCNNQDGEGDTFRIYDHRTEGEIHINKRDMNLEDGESDRYNSYGDTQGDGTLEGAVYGLFAATDMIHPDGKTGTVFETNNLVAVTTTDKKGDASFLAITEAPGHFYDYGTGAITKTANGWADMAPKNLYMSNTSYDDYTEDGVYERGYTDNAANNGNCWIGRPLMLGSYYVKELTRSEGYELSIGNKGSQLTNNGQDYTMALPTGTGYANISRNLYVEGQISNNPTGEFGNPDGDEIFFTAESKGTGAAGFDVVLSKLPAGARIYRLDTGKKIIEVETGTGVFDQVYLANEDGSPKYVKAEHDYQYPKYNPDGSPMTTEVTINYQANQFLTMAPKPLDTGKTQTAMESAEPSMSKEQVAAKLAGDFVAADKDFLKGKVERALRANGKSSPKLTVNGKPDYSSIYVGIYDAGIREGEPDPYGVSGVDPGEPAARTVYGSPIETLEISKEAGGKSIKVGDAILSVLDYYNTNSFYSYGGIHQVTETADKFLVTVYAGTYGNPANFMVMGTDPEADSVIYHRLSHLPDNVTKTPRYVYATYSNNPSAGAFGTYENYKGETLGSTYFSSALLITDAVMGQNDSLMSKIVKQNVYYRTGESPMDETGNLIRAFEYREQTIQTTQEVEIKEWTELPLTSQNGVQVGHIDSSYTDRYGVSHQDATLQSYHLRVLLPQKEVTLTQDDIDNMGDPGDWTAGESMGSGTYYLAVKHTIVKSHLNYKDLTSLGDSSYVQPVELAYPNQDDVWQDGQGKPGANTRTSPVALQERPIKQQIKVTKTIDKDSYNHNNTYGEIHEDWFTKWFGGFGNQDQTAQKMDNFRFKTYLKSNLERLYRDENGTVEWQDRKGTTIDILAANEAYPEKASKIFTRVLHRTDPLYQNSQEAVVANQELYSFVGEVIEENQNPGYTAILETIEKKVPNRIEGRGGQVYNYEKFFDALQSANTDKWDNRVNQGKTFITWEAWNAPRDAWNDSIDFSTPDSSYKPFARILSNRYSQNHEDRSSYPAVLNNQEIKNERNTGVEAKNNAMSSDAVRQFAIKWYLEAEVKKLVQETEGGETVYENGAEIYPDETYDRALFQAIKKANNYLTPFYRYDLDQIYAIRWDSAPNGGKDRDATTLSADTNFGSDKNNQEGYYYGVSQYLPYGTYVVAEQQPRFADLGDFKNRHYRIDKPKEVILPQVYHSYQGSQQSPEITNDYYHYDSLLLQKEAQRRYKIRFQEESHVVYAHNHYGDFEIYKYGMDVNRITNGAERPPGTDDYFALTQYEYRPYKNYYNQDDNRNTGIIPYYLSEGQDGREEISKYYRYSSVSEHAGTSDGAATMSGVQTAYQGTFASMLVPYTVVAPVSADTEGAETVTGPDGESSYRGYTHIKFTNRFYNTRLRIEKLDSETGESILHDEAIFALYAASREDDKAGDGTVDFYEEPTILTGSREFLEAMGAENIRTKARDMLDPDDLDHGIYYGTVPAGTPVCREEEQIVLQDQKGNKTGSFRSFTTKRDGMVRKEGGPGFLYGDQNVGYVETPEPLGAGTYVLAEKKPPAGYVRSKPVAIEVYSDQVSYYRDGNRDQRVAAAIYESLLTTDVVGNPTGKEFSQAKEAARIYVGNTPIRLEVSKKKTDEQTITYGVSGRVEGTITQLNGNYGLENLELAYHSSGAYLGYGWLKGTAEYLAARKKAGEDVKLHYEKGVFSGYADVTRQLETKAHGNRYVPGATLTLYDALEVKKNGGSQDFAYDGLTVERDRNSNVKRMYITEGYAGSKVEFLYRQESKAWDYSRVRRGDTDILFYNLGNLKVLEEDGAGVRYSYDKTGKRIRIIPGVTTTIYAIQNNRPVFEITGRDFSELRYDPWAKAFGKIGADNQIYHLDADGIRDSQVDPYTGMAYVIEVVTGQNGRLQEKVLVWPVNVIKDSYGDVLGRHKIKTSRIATIHADTSMEYIGGTYDRKGVGKFDKWMNPVLDSNGRVVYFQKSNETYEKSQPAYDRDGDFLYDRYDDNLEAFNQDAYTVKDLERVFDKGILWDESDNRNEVLLMRQGDHYILENTWVSGERTPNDPFHTEETGGQADMLKRVIPGTYILEELRAPEGYVRSMPEALTVAEHGEVQKKELVNETIKVEFAKTDSPPLFQKEKKSAYSYQPVSGAKMALYRAKRQYTSDWEQHPKGWYLVKAEETPFTWIGSDQQGESQLRTAQWITGEHPLWLEGIPAGDYFLEEEAAPEGYVRAKEEIVIQPVGDVQSFLIPNDHTKIEIFKYQTVNGKKEAMPNRHAATLALYPVKTDAEGSIIWQGRDPVDLWQTDDCKQYTSLLVLTPYQPKSWLRNVGISLGLVQEQVSGFEHDFEKLYRQYGDQLEEIHWFYTDEPWDGAGELPNLREGSARKIESYEADRTGCQVQLWEREDGKKIRISIAPDWNRSTDERGVFSYQYHYKRLSENIVSYEDQNGIHRMDYVPWQQEDQSPAAYLLVEIQTPEGYIPAKSQLIFVTESTQVQFYEMENVAEPIEEPEPPTKPEPPTESEPEPTTVPDETTLPQEPPEESKEEPTVPGEPETIPPYVPEKPEEPSVPPQIPNKERIPKFGYLSGIYLSDHPVAKAFGAWEKWRLAKTGDQSMTWIWMIVLSLSGVRLVYEVRRKKSEGKMRKGEKKKTKNNHTTDGNLDGIDSDSNDNGL